MRYLIFFILLFFSAPSFSQTKGTIIKKHGKYGYKVGHKWIARPRYDSMRPYSENRAAVMKKGSWGYIDEKGEKIVKPKYLAVCDFNGGLAGVKEAARHGWTMIDKEGKQFAYDYMYDTIVYLDSFALGTIATHFAQMDSVYTIYHYYNRNALCQDVDSIVKHGNVYLLIYGYHILWGNWEPTYQIIDSRAEIVTPCFKPIDSVFLKPVVITKQECCGKAVLTTDAHLSDWYDDVGVGMNGCWIIENKKKFGVINSDLKEIITPDNSKITYTGRLFMVRDNKTTALYDTSGKKLTPVYEQLYYIGEGIYKAKNRADSSYVLYNAQGVILPKQYHLVYDYKCGLARVVSDDQKHFAYIDTSGEIISRWYDCAVDFHVFTGGGGGGIFRVIMGIATAGLSEVVRTIALGSDSNTEKDLDDTGTTPYTGDYSYFTGSDFHNGYSLYALRRKAPSPNTYKEEPVYYGLIDSTGKELTKAEYKSIVPLDTFFIVEKTAGYGLITRSGKLILSPRYGKIYNVRSNYFRIEDPDFSLNSALYHYDGTKGSFLTSFQYSTIIDGGDSAFIVQQYAEYGYVDLKGKFFIPMKYFRAEPFKDGKAKVSFKFTGGEFYINRKGKKVEY